jgi:hypothetical protein
VDERYAPEIESNEPRSHRVIAVMALARYRELAGAAEELVEAIREADVHHEPEIELAVQTVEEALRRGGYPNA